MLKASLCQLNAQCIPECSTTLVVFLSSQLMFCFILCISCVGDTSPRQMFEQVVAGVCVSLIQYILNTCVELMSPFVGIVDKGQATFPCQMKRVKPLFPVR